MMQASPGRAIGCAALGLFLAGYGCGGGGSGEEEMPPGDGLDGGVTSGAAGSQGQGGAGSQPNSSSGGSQGSGGRAGGGLGGSGAGGFGAGGFGGRPMGFAGAGGFGGRPMGGAGGFGGLAGRDGARDGGADRGGNQCQAGNMCTQNCTRACLAGLRPGMQSCLCNNGQYFCGGCDPTDAGLPDVPQNFICPAGTAAGAMCTMRGQNCLLQSDGGIGRLCTCGGDVLTWTCRGN